MSKECMVDGCQKESSKRGYCNAHYLRLRRNGTTDRVRKIGRDQCNVDGCKNHQAAHGWCNKHYRRWQRTGNPEKVITTVTGEPHQYFAEVVLKHDGDECLSWPYGKHVKGYGHLWKNDRPSGVHILVCEHFYGVRPNGAHAAHSCGNANCCNWKHIRWATPSENNQDKKEHGTWQGGEANGNSRLKEAQVREVKKLGESGLAQRKIARKFDVSQRTIWAILNGKIWSHVTI